MLNIEAIISAAEVMYSYSEGANALNALSLDVRDGEFLAILGPNGSGKSTFAKLVNALLVPSGGELSVMGCLTSDEENTWNIRQNAGMLFQNPDNQIVASIVEEDVAFGPENLGVPSNEIRQRVDWALATVGMSDYALNSPHFLSGGQKQRVSIAGVLAMKPKIIILDEPTAMLDPIGRREVLAQALKLNREEGITILLITHYMEEAVEADRICVLKDGSVAMLGTPVEVFTRSAELRGLGLDVPQVTEAGARLLELGLPIKPGILTIDEMVEELCRIKSL